MSIVDILWQSFCVRRQYTCAVIPVEHLGRSFYLWGMHAMRILLNAQDGAAIVGDIKKLIILFYVCTHPIILNPVKVRALLIQIFLLLPVTP